MATKAQIARRKYGESLINLSAGEKAAVTREFNAQGSSPAIRRMNTPVTGSNTLLVKFGRPSVNGVSECFVNEGTTLGEALTQAKIKLSPKEGVIDKDTKSMVSVNDKVTDGAKYIIVPGVDSSY